MNKTNYTARPYIMKSGQIMIRVRWDKRSKKLDFVSVIALTQRNGIIKTISENNTTHKSRGRRFTQPK